MICKDLKVIFVHIPKTAGQSIERFFLEQCGLTWEQRSQFLLRPNSDPQLGPKRLAHLTAAEYVSCGHLSQEDFADYYKFSFVRNPWDRLVSEYYFYNYHQKYSFKEFVLHGFPGKAMEDDYRHIMPQYDFLYDSQGERIVDFVGRFENLKADFNVICDTLNIKRRNLPHVNESKQRKYNRLLDLLLPFKSQKRKYSEYYDKETMEIVAERYKKDIETFKYMFA
jgi:hypothetical protein